MKRERMKFRPAPGAEFGEDRAQIYGERIQFLIERSGGPLSPHLVVADARDPASPLHDYFEWDDRAAADKHRLYQARNLINHIEVEFVNQNGAAETVRAFFNITETGQAERGYVSVEMVQHDDAHRQVLIAEALAALEHWRKRYGHLKELAAVVDALVRLKGKDKKNVDR